MKKVLITIFMILTISALNAQITLTVGSALLQTPGTDIHIPVSVQGLNAATGGIPVTGIELHIKYTNSILVYDTTVNFNAIVPASQWYYGANDVEYSANWVEPGLNKLNIPDNTVLFEIVFQYLGNNTDLIFDSTRCILLDSAFEIIPNVHYVNGRVTPSQGSGGSRWNGTGEWNSTANWSNGIPGDSTDAIIETGNVHILSNAVCKSFTINQGAEVNLPPGFSFTINKDYVNSGLFNMLSDATGTGSVIVKGVVSGQGTNNFGRYLDFSSGSAHLVSSPVTSALAGVFGTNLAEKYIESTASWQTLLPGDNLIPGLGYRVNGSIPATFTFQGIFNTTDITASNLSYTTSLSPETRGLNLLGNPFPSAIQWEQGGWSRTNLDYAVYVWKGYKYVTWNGVTGALTDGIIPAMQGFLVRSNALAGALTIPSDARIHSTEPYNKGTESLENLISLKLENTSGDGYFDETFIHVVPGSSAGYDGANDAWKLFGNNSHPQIYTTGTDQSNLSINTFPDFTSVPVEFRVGNAGSYKISFINFESFNLNQPLYFEDKKTSSIINIKNTNEFVFSTDVLTEPGRFILHFQEVGLNDFVQDHFSVWISGHSVHVVCANGNMLIEQCELFNSMGQLISTIGRMETPAEFVIQDNLQGLYILRITTQEGSFTKKILISRIP